MNNITSDIHIQGGQTAFIPGQMIRGGVQWLCEEAPKKARLRLLWYTEGRGTEDVGVVEKVKFDDPNRSDNRSFEFELPIGPYSFSGGLISLIWALELQVDKEVRRCEFVLSPSGKEIDLSHKVKVTA